jgi:hypothetical protein
LKRGWPEDVAQSLMRNRATAVHDKVGGRTPTGARILATSRFDVIAGNSSVSGETRRQRVWRLCPQLKEEARELSRQI